MWRRAAAVAADSGLGRLSAAFRVAPSAALSLSYYGAIGLFNPYFPLWLSHLGYSSLVIGAFASLQSWTRIVAPYGWGWLADHGGRRVALLRLACTLSALAAAALWLVRDAGNWPLAAAVAALFLANGAVMPIGEALLLKQLHGADGLDTRRYGRVRMWGSVGFIVSVLAFGVLLELAGIGALPLFTGALFLLLAGAAWALPRQHDAGSAAALPRADIRPVLRRTEVRWFFAGVMLTVLAHTALYAFFSVYLRELGYGKPAVGVLWAVSVAVEIAFFAFAGRHFARIDDYRWLVLAALVTAARFAATAAFGHVPAVLVLAQLTHVITFAAQHMACTQPDRAPFPRPAAHARLRAVHHAGLWRARPGRWPRRWSAERGLRPGRGVLGGVAGGAGQRRLLRDGGTGGAPPDVP